MIQHPKMIEFDNKLKDIFNTVDDFLEDNYGDLFPLHPVRARRGDTSNKSHDGLFSVTSSYTTGIGSEKGKGYAVEVRFATLKTVEKKVKEKVEKEVINLIDKLLDEKFSERELNVAKDGNVIKIYGDLSLGQL